MVQKCNSVTSIHKTDPTQPSTDKLLQMIVNSLTLYGVRVCGTRFHFLSIE